MTRISRWFWVVVAVQATFLLAWAGWHEHVRSHAQVVRLKTRPVDPRDLLRGDYMVLRYEISELSPPARGEERSPGDRFWVVLEPRDGFYTAVSASWDKPAVAAPRLAVRGWSSARSGTAYGIETYYVPEGKGTPRFKSLEVEAVVSATHRLQIKRLFVDGQPYP